MKGEPSALSFLLGTEGNSPASTQPGWKDKIELFKKEPQLHHDEDALVWWKSNADRFPTIAKLVGVFFVYLQPQSLQRESSPLLGTSSAARGVA